MLKSAGMAITIHRVLRATVLLISTAYVLDCKILFRKRSKGIVGAGWEEDLPFESGAVLTLLMQRFL
jgi:hypothetical protein